MRKGILSFDSVAELYDKVRPGYPEALFEDLVAKGDLTESSTILEVGCGTGQATKGLYQITKNIICVEPGKQLATIAKQKYPACEFIETTFEECGYQSTVDVIFSATAWHWTDPKTAYHKAAEILGERGLLVLVRNYHIETDKEAFHKRAQHIYKKYSDQHMQRLTSKEKVEKAQNQINTDIFTVTETLEYPWTQTYSIDEYIDLRRTYSDHNTMEADDRIAFEEELRTFATEYYQGMVTKNYRTVMLIAHLKEDTTWLGHSGSEVSP